MVLHGHSGSGKSTLLRSLYANYLPDEGHIRIRHNDEWVDLGTGPARKVLEVAPHDDRLGEPVLRVIPRISRHGRGDAALLDLGVPREACATKAASLLTRLQRAGAPVASRPVDLFRRRAAKRSISPADLSSTTRFYFWMNPPPSLDGKTAPPWWS